MSDHIQGIEGLSDRELREELERGAKFVRFKYCVSICILTFSRETAVQFIRSDESAAAKSLPWTLLSLAFGWWGFPFGLIFTPMALFTNLSGGRDVTDAVVPFLLGDQEEAEPVF